MATLYDVARLAGVSTATVSRVLHGQDRVRDSTRVRVQRAIEDLGYVPDGAAQSLSRRRKEVIGLICIERPTRSQDVENTNLVYTDELLRGVEARIRELDWSLLFRFWNGSTDPDFPRLAALSGKVDGVLVSEGSFPARLMERLTRRGLPVVVLAGQAEHPSVDVVTADNRAGAAALTRHLVTDHGMRRLYYLDGPADAPDAEQRRRGLEQVLATHPEAALIGGTRGTFSVESGLLAGQRILDTHQDRLPDVIICANDQMALGVLRTLHRAGLSVPRDVAVTGFDDIFPDNLSDPPLTTVHQPMRELGERGCDRLLRRIGTPGLLPAAELLPTELVLRRSCGCPPGQARRIPVSAEPANTLPEVVPS